MLSRRRQVTILIIGVAVLASSLAVALGAIAQAAGKPAGGRNASLAGSASAIGPNHLVRIVVLSSRADLVSGGDALVQVLLPPGTPISSATIDLDGKNVTHQFALRPNGQFEGLLTGLQNGPNVLTATLRDGYGARLDIDNHPIGGPVLSGPQLEPWTCEAGARDKQCDQPPSFSYLYVSSNPSKSGFQTYDPSNPPSDVATTTTDQGVTVPFIVRVETGYMDRDQYQIAALYQPGKPWAPWTPQRQWNHKLLLLHGASCGVDHTTGTAPSTTTDGISSYALGRGFIIASTALDNSGHNCNLALQAESLVMAKEYIVKTYGTIRYTIGSGCSGGSLAQQWIANAYPGVYQGILPTCSFPDAWSTATQFLDYHLLLAYFKDPSKWGSGVAWTPTQMGDVLGGPDGFANAQVSDTAQFHVAVPTDPCAGTTDADRYNPTTNPGGVRCTIQDAAINVFGPEPPALWSANEKKLGRGFVRPPIDNVGVQYGFGALEQGEITPAQFVDLNAKAGGLDIDINPTTTRIDAAGAPSLANAYRSGMINETNNLNQTAIIDCRGPNPGLFHDAYRAFAVRARLDRENGTHANQLIWEGPEPLEADTQCERNSFIAMDRWLAAIEKDTSNTPLAQKIIRDKPSDLTDECWSGSGTKVSNELCPAGVVNVEGTPRTVAGDSITTDDNKCQLKPLRQADYNVTFTSAEWTQLEQIFPTGVCDFSKPGVAQQPTIPWQTYQTATGKVIYGGRPLGPAPVSQPFGPGCSPAPDRIDGTRLGAVTLGMTRAQARRAFGYVTTRGRTDMDFFCQPPYGIRVGYPSPKLLRTLSPSERTRVSGRVVLALTANQQYSLRGARPGMRLASVGPRLGVGRGYQIGLNWWYLFPNGPSRGIFKVRHGVIEEVGIANLVLTRNRAAAWVFLTSF